MTVESFDPGAVQAPLLESDARALLAEAQVQDDQLVLASERASHFARFAVHDGWQALAQQFTDAELLQLCRIFTLGEMQLAGWTAGDKSPVIALVAELKRRGSFTTDDKRWIKAHTDNRFLPHGNLMARL